MTYFCKLSIEPCIRGTKTAAAAVGLTLSFLTMAVVLAGDTAFAAGDEPKICSRAKALGYDESTDVFLKYIKSSIDKRELCTKRFWELFQPKPLVQILGDDEQRQFYAAIDQGDCNKATELLSARFAAAHPMAPLHRTDASSRLSWRVAMSHHFYESIGLCKDLRQIDRALADIDTEGLKPRPFWSLRKNFYVPTTTFPPPVRNMYSSVASLLYEMGRTQSPKVALEVLRVSNEGRALKLHPHYEVYIALRLRELGMADPIINDLIERPLDPKTRRLVEERVRNKDPGDLPKFAEKSD